MVKISELEKQLPRSTARLMECCKGCKWPPIKCAGNYGLDGGWTQACMNRLFSDIKTVLHSSKDSSVVSLNFLNKKPVKTYKRAPPIQ